MEEIQFQIQGSAKEPYVITCRKDESHFTLTCTCPAGKFEKWCKHRTHILAGISEGIVSDNADAILEVSNWLQGTPIENAAIELQKAENEYEAIKKRVAKCKTNLLHLLQPKDRTL